MTPMNEATRAFIQAHRTQDVRDVALHAKREPDVDMPFALNQIAGWQIARTKLPRLAAADAVWYPPHLAMEQCSSEFTAQYKANVAARLLDTAGMARDAFVDLTGGFGIDFSYMAQGFAHATYVERQTQLCEIAEHNMHALGLTHVTIVNADSTEFVHTMPDVSMIFIDPARRDDHGARTYAIQDCTPDVLALKNELLSKAPFVMIKLSPMLDWHKTVADFGGNVSEVHIVATGNECKELDLALTRERTSTVDVMCINDAQTYTFQAHINALSGLTVDNEPSREAHGGNDVDNPVVAHTGHALVDENNSLTTAMHMQQSVVHELPVDMVDALKACAKRTVVMEHSERVLVLFEPNAALMKAGCFSEIERDFNVAPLAPNSHLFVTQVAREALPSLQLPGRMFVIDAVASMNKKSLRGLVSDMDRANIAVRNFPLSAQQLRKKLKLNDGGNVYVFATTDAHGQHVILKTTKIAKQ